MELTLLNTSLDAVAIIDDYESAIWTDRYHECGDFEIYTPVTPDVLSVFKQDYYLLNRDSEHVMIVEKLLIKTDVELGNHATVTGRSLESILMRRIVWKQRSISGNLQNGIRTLLEENVISPEDEDRKIDNFIFEESTDDRITSLQLDTQYTGDELYDVISKLCKEHDIGFKVTLNDNKQFVFKLYMGADRSYEQTENPYVIFSPNFENIVNSNYIESKSALKNVTLIGGEGEGSARRYITVGSARGLERRELFTDARDISSTTESDEKLTDDEYNAKLKQRGEEKLSENIDITSFEGEIETTMMFRYREDFFDGDIVQIANEYGHETKARIVEMTTSENEQGTSVYPTFSTITEKGE
jgi:hypothetical protein